MDLTLRKFNPKVIEKRRQKGCNSIVCIVGKRATGKTTMAIDIYKELKGLSSTIVMTPESNKKVWENYVDEKFIFNKFDINLLGEIIERQRTIIRDFKNKGIDPYKHPEIDVCIVIEEPQLNSELFEEKYMKELFFNAKLYHITAIITFQYLLFINPEYHTNIDYFIACNDNHIDNQKRLHEYFFRIISKFNNFQILFNTCTDDHGFLVIDNTTNSAMIDDHLFWYKSNKEIVKDNVKEVKEEVIKSSFLSKFLSYFK